jgi:hypothetical protein
MNLIVGEQGPNYKDWDQDGIVTGDSNGFGLDLNGSNLGYFGAVYTEADNTVKSRNASEQMLGYGEDLKICVQNLAQWTPQLEELLIAILEAPAGSDLNEQIVDVVILADKLLNGIDLNNNGTIEPIVGECGAQFAYTYAYGIADMPLISTGLVAGFGTPTPPGGLFEPTSIGGNNDNGNGSPVSTQVPGHTPPGQVKTKKPTKTPKGNDNNGNNK